MTLLISAIYIYLTQIPIPPQHLKKKTGRALTDLGVYVPNKQGRGYNMSPFYTVIPLGHSLETREFV